MGTFLILYALGVLVALVICALLIRESGELTVEDVGYMMAASLFSWMGVAFVCFAIWQANGSTVLWSKDK